MFILTEQIMNGTVTIEIQTSLVDKPTFEEAVQYVREKTAAKNLKLSNDRLGESGWWFSIEQDDNNPFKLFCHLPKEQVKYL